MLNFWTLTHWLHLMTAMLQRHNPLLQSQSYSDYIMLTCEASCIMQTEVRVSLCCEVAAMHTPVAYLCLGLGSKSPVNQTAVIRNCLHRRGAIVCPDGELIPPRVLPARRHTGCLEIPSQIKSGFSLWYLHSSASSYLLFPLKKLPQSGDKKRRERSAAILLLTD